MSEHSSSVFNNSCVKLPRNPKSNQPLAIYEQKFLNQLQNEVTKLRLDSPSNNMPEKSKDSTKSFIEFVDSIPEYDDLNHLSNREFYKKIEFLKEKQKSFYNVLQDNEMRNKTCQWIEDYQNMATTPTKIAKRTYADNKKAEKPFCITPILNKKGTKQSDDTESETIKPPSRRSVRIETPTDPETTPSDLFRRPKSRLQSAASRMDDWDDTSTVNEYKLDFDPPTRPKSAPSSPTKYKPSVAWKDTITIPQPFQMTVRDEENQIVDELLIKPTEKQHEMFKAHSVPIESQIPLFDKLMADQEHKNFMTRERRKAELQSQMRPFSFTKRDEEIQTLTRRLSKSSPSLFLDDPPIKVRKFKAKPVPKNLFSNYIYQKMNEDEFYRALQKKIRAEEMLRAASLPPSMAKREKTALKFDVCPRSYRDLIETPPNHHQAKNAFDRELTHCNISGISPCPLRTHLKKEFARRSKRAKRKPVHSNPSPSSATTRTVSSLGLRSVSRSNLAAVLRIQSAHERLEREMGRRLEEARVREEARWREKLMRRRPVWQTLAYSHEEELAMRLQLRRDEERLRGEEHRLRMALMLGRVEQQPTLFERQSHLRYPKTRQELLDKLYAEYNAKKSELRCMKDAAIQALLEEEETVQSKESEEEEEEEKEKCDLSSEDN